MSPEETAAAGAAGRPGAGRADAATGATAAHAGRAGKAGLRNELFCAPNRQDALGGRDESPRTGREEFQTGIERRERHPQACNEDAAVASLMPLRAVACLQPQPPMPCDNFIDFGGYDRRRKGLIAAAEAWCRHRPRPFRATPGSGTGGTAPAQWMPTGTVMTVTWWGTPDTNDTAARTVPA